MGAGFLPGHLATFDGGVQVCSGVPNTDLSGGVVELVRVCGRAQPGCFRLGDPAGLDHLVELLEKALASLRFQPVLLIHHRYLAYPVGVCKIDDMETTSAPETTHAFGYSVNKDKLLKRLARAEGQVRGVARMVEDDRYCIDILTQLAAVDTALESVALEILDDHVKHCVAGALVSGDEAEGETKIDELLAAVRRFAKTR